LSRFEGRGDLEAEISERYAVIRMKTGYLAIVVLEKCLE